MKVLDLLPVKEIKFLKKAPELDQQLEMIPAPDSATLEKVSYVKPIEVNEVVSEKSRGIEQQDTLYLKKKNYRLFSENFDFENIQALPRTKCSSLVLLTTLAIFLLLLQGLLFSLLFSYCNKEKFLFI